MPAFCLHSLPKRWWSAAAWFKAGNQKLHFLALSRSALPLLAESMKDYDHVLSSGPLLPPLHVPVIRVVEYLKARNAEVCHIL